MQYKKMVFLAVLIFAVITAIIAGAYFLNSGYGGGIYETNERKNPVLCQKDCLNSQKLTADSNNEDVKQNEEKMVSDTQFITGLKLDNPNNIKELSKIYFQIAKESNLDYILVPVKFARGSEANETDWSQGVNYYYIFELSKQYGISVLPAFFKLGHQDDKNAEKYAGLIISFLDEFYKDGNIKFVEFQNEPVKKYDEDSSARFKGTAADLARSHTAAYNKIKAKYPNITVGTAGFMAMAVSEEENILMNGYYKEYFSAKPKFDMLNLHHYPKRGGYIQTDKNSLSNYNFLSEYEILDTYGKLLDDYGYGGKSIFVSEGNVGMPFKNQDGSAEKDWINNADAKSLLLQRFALFLENGGKNNVIAAMTSSNDAKFTGLIEYDQKTQNFSKNELFDFYKYFLELMKKYPYYIGHNAGKTDDAGYWVLEFRNEENKKMWIAFNPFLFWAEASSFEKQQAIAVRKSVSRPQIAYIDVGSANSVKIMAKNSEKIVSPENGRIFIEIKNDPVFVEENNP